MLSILYLYEKRHQLCGSRISMPAVNSNELHEAKENGRLTIGETENEHELRMVKSSGRKQNKS